jgi:hypothetical protein
MDRPPLALFPDKWKAHLSGRTIYFSAIVCAVFLCFLYLTSLSVGITFDGHLYIDLADMLGTSRFPAEWSRSRTPLFPLALKFSFWLSGKQPLALVSVPSAAGLVGILVLGIIVKELAGYGAAAVSIVAVSLFPTLVSYERFVLTETGTFLFIAVMVLLSLRTPQDARSAWWKTLGLILVCSVGYYWRQNLLTLSYWLAFLHLVGWRFAQPEKFVLREHGAGLASTLAQCVLIVLVPNVAAQFWAPYSNNAALRDLMLQFGIVKQALPDPKDPLIGEDAQAYQSAIQSSQFQGHLYSGLRADLDNPLARKIFSRYSGSCPALFVRLVRDYPGRYAAAVGRTALLFAGAKGLQDENEIFRDQILSPVFSGARIGDGREPVSSRDKELFAQKTQPSAVQAMLRFLVGLYDPVLRFGFLICAAGLVLSFVWLDFRLFLFTATPFVYLLPYLVVLSSVDRYAFPVYPFVLAAPLVVGVSAGKRRSARPRGQHLQPQAVQALGAKFS